MSPYNLFIYFMAGGLFTTLIVALEEYGQRTLSGLATLIPVFTLVAYFFIGQSKGGVAVAQHAKWVLAGTLVSWVPYMLVVALLAPRLGPHQAIATGLVVFFMMALLYIAITNHFHFNP